MADENEVKPATKSLAEIKKPAQQAVVSMGFGNSESFALMQRAANLLANSTLVPVAYRTLKEIKDFGKVVGYEENPNAIPNCVVALNMAQRMGADPLMVMQNLYIVEGRPSWSSQFIIAAINSCGRYSPLRFELSPIGKLQELEYTATEWVKVQGQKDQRKEVLKKISVSPRTCVAWATELATGDRLESPMVSMDMAVAEGWIQKNGSKWQTMPEVMLRYRAAAFFGKLYAPELLMGLQTAEEAHDIIDVQQQPNGQYAATLDELRGESKTGAAPQPEDAKLQPEAETVDVKEQPTAGAEPEAQPQAEQQQVAEVTDADTGEVIQQGTRAETDEEADFRRGIEAEERKLIQQGIENEMRSMKAHIESTKPAAASADKAAPTSRVRRRTADSAPE